METLLIERNGRLFLTNTARVVRVAGDVTEDLAAAANWKLEQSNPYIKWITGDFVESDKANSNTQFWTKDDLAMNEYSIKYSPLNMLHKQSTPVGFFASTQTIPIAANETWDDESAVKPFSPHQFIRTNIVNRIVPEAKDPGVVCGVCGLPEADPMHATDSDPLGGFNGEEQSAAGGRLKIQALSGMWSHIFPFEASLVDQADEMGSLFYSMECRGTHLHCAGPNGCDQTFDYMRPEDHCQHLKERTSIRHIVNPTFRGGALIIPPTKPGWKDAHASVFEQSLREEASRYAEITEAAFDQVNASGADLTPAAWEYLMATVLTLGNK